MDNQSSSEFKDEPVMITAGLDIGHQSVKGIILADRQIIRHITLKLSGEVDASAKIACERLLTEARLQPSQVGRVFATGIEREKVSIADGHRTEMLCHLKGAHWLFPGARTVIDLGAEGIRVLRGDAEGNLRDFMMNDKCAAGTGRSLEVMANLLQVRLEDIGPLSLAWTGEPLKISNTCVVFAKTEVLSLRRRGVPLNQILAGLCDGIAEQVKGLIRRLGLEEEWVISGGISKNIGVVKRLEEKLGVKAQICFEPQIVGAVGAALFAAAFSKKEF